jgi:hypothetical protein
LAVPAFAADAEPDPFAGVAESAAAPRESKGWAENLGFRKELMLELAVHDGQAARSRQIAGFELLKKFSTETRTVAAFDFQGRLVHRDRFNQAPRALSGMDEPGWKLEHHNAYVDVYNLILGRVNARVGKFYVPFGLNLQTDTHGTLLQLSNEQNFGFERDWYAGLYGGLTDGLDYDAYYMAGAGMDLKGRGQKGLAAARISLARSWLHEKGLEGGLSALGGTRLYHDDMIHETMVVDTRRAGLDFRVGRPAPAGRLTWTTEVSGGGDDREAVFTQLHQAEYLHRSRKWGLASQYRRFWREDRGAVSSIIGEASLYFRNDVGNSDLHWIKLDLERRLERRGYPPATIFTAQYYRYW